MCSGCRRFRCFGCTHASQSRLKKEHSNAMLRSKHSGATWGPLRPQHSRGRREMLINLKPPRFVHQPSFSFFLPSGSAFHSFRCCPLVIRFLTCPISRQFCFQSFARLCQNTYLLYAYLIRKISVSINIIRPVAHLLIRLYHLLQY